MKESNTVNEPNDIQNTENSSQHSETEPEAKRKPPKKRPRVSQRKELAVVTIGMVAAITSFGGLLAGHQAQAEQSAADTAPAAQVSSPDPGSSSSGQPSKDDEAPAYSPAPQDNAPAKASHAQSQGS
jgi:hypothetical protein